MSGRARRTGAACALLALALAGLTIGAGAACNALSGVGELGVGPLPCEGCQTAEAGGDAAMNEAGTDASRDTSVETSARPSFCNGLVLYARFDGSLVTAQGLDPDQPPATSFDAGKYGGAALLSGANGALYYRQGDGGFRYPRPGEGTIAMWLRPLWTWPSSTDRILWKALPDRTTGLAPTVTPHLRSDVNDAFFGSTNTGPDGGTVSAGATFDELVPYWRDKEWNHLAETWSQSAPTLTFTLNGASGDPSVTHRETSAPWLAGTSTFAFLRVASNIASTDAFYDDLALWERALSLEEIRALYAANAPLGDVCGL